MGDKWRVWGLYGDRIYLDMSLGDGHSMTNTAVTEGMFRHGVTLSMTTPTAQFLSAKSHILTFLPASSRHMCLACYSHLVLGDCCPLAYSSRVSYVKKSVRGTCGLGLTTTDRGKFTTPHLY